MKKLKGTVVSDKMNNTVVVRVDRLKKHPKYMKYYRVSEKFKADDPERRYRQGDLVIIQETRPISKDKRWRVVELVKRQEQSDAENVEETERP